MRWRVTVLPVELHRLLAQHGTGLPLRFQRRNTLLHICERVQDAILKNDREHRITTAEINVLSDRSHQFLLTSRALLGSDRVPLLRLVVDRDDRLILIGRQQLSVDRHCNREQATVYESIDRYNFNDRVDRYTF